MSCKIEDSLAGEPSSCELFIIPRVYSKLWMSSVSWKSLQRRRASLPSIQMMRINFSRFFSILPFHVFPRSVGDFDIVRGNHPFFSPNVCMTVAPFALSDSGENVRTSFSHESSFAFCHFFLFLRWYVCAWILPGHHEPHEKIDRVVNVRNTYSSSPHRFHNVFPLVFSARVTFMNSREWIWEKPPAISRLMESRRFVLFPFLATLSFFLNEKIEFVDAGVSKKISSSITRLSLTNLWNAFWMFNIQC